MLINGHGERFMAALHPLAELAPRDIVARGVFAEIAAGRGAFLDAARRSAQHFAEHFPTVYASCIAGRHRSGARSRSRSRPPRIITWAASPWTPTAAPR